MRKRYVLFTLLLGLLVMLAACGGDKTDNSDKHYTVAVYNAVPGVFDEIGENLIERMVELGYVEGDNITYVHISSGDELTAALETEVDVIVSSPGRMAYLSGAPVGDTPVVFVPSGDPIGQGLAESIGQPGGSSTGIWQTDAVERRLQLLHDLVPDVTVMYAIYDSTDESTLEQLASVEAVGASLGIEIITAAVSSADQTANQRALANIPDEAGAIFLVGNNAAGLGNGWSEAAIRHNIPLSAVGTATVNTSYGPLMSYGPEMASMGKQAANLVHQILQGALPAELPIETAEFFLTIDLRVAEMIGLDVPDTILRQATTIYRIDTAGELPPLPDVVPETVDMIQVSSGACNAKLTTMGGTNTVCATLSCGDLPGSAMMVFSEQDPASACTNENLVGTCTTADYQLLFYDGEPASLQIGCGFMQGTWETAGG